MPDHAGPLAQVVEPHADCLAVPIFQQRAGLVLHNLHRSPDLGRLVLSGEPQGRFLELQPQVLEVICGL